jgi:hypothetical protein
MLKRIKNYINDNFVRGNINKNDCSGALHRAWGHVYTNFLKGDYLEFGVYTGNTLIESYKNYLSFKNWIDHQMVSDEAWRREKAKHYVNHVSCFHALDSFEGMPENSEEHIMFANGGCKADCEIVKTRCANVGLKPPQLCVHKGVFSYTKENLYKSMGNKKAAIINIDCDLYESAKDVLAICESFIQIGTVLLFDDYNCFSADNNRGERKAFREFRESSKLEFDSWFSFFYAGQAFLCVGDRRGKG